MRILFIGDIVGRPGRRAVRELLPDLRKENKPDLVLANGENMASGFGLTVDTYREVLDYGVDYMTSGNHIWDKAEIIPILETQAEKLLRPANFPDKDPGRGYTDLLVSGERVRVINLIGKVNVGKNCSSPFEKIDQILGEPNCPAIIFIDFHAEATSEKIAFAWHVDGRASAVTGTHTHVQTNDARVTKKGTAALTDAGMTGPRDGVLGIDKDIIVQSFLTSQPWRGEVAEGPMILSGFVVDIDSKTGRATGIELIKREIEA
jgi:metallophosphoesterase (TIGR00282 family)